MTWSYWINIFTYSGWFLSIVTCRTLVLCVRLFSVLYGMGKWSGDTPLVDLFCKSSDSIAIDTKQHYKLVMNPVIYIMKSLEKVVWVVRLIEHWFVNELYHIMGHLWNVCENLKLMKITCYMVLCHNKITTTIFIVWRSSSCLVGLLLCPLTRTILTSLPRNSGMH